MAASDGAYTNLELLYLQVEHYVAYAVHFAGNRDDFSNGWNGGNRVFGCLFQDLGNLVNGGGTGYAGIDLVYSQDLRATFSTWARRAGKTDVWIAERTGHQSTEMIDRYTRAVAPPRSAPSSPTPLRSIYSPRVSGRPFEAFVTDELLAPLGAPLSFRLDAEPREDVARGHVPRWSPMGLALCFIMPSVASWVFDRALDGFVPLRAFELDTAAIGGLSGAAEAFLPMLHEMLRREDGVLRRDSEQTMLTLQARGAAGIVSREGVGIGWKLGSADGVTFWNHEGGGPGFCSETRRYPDEQLGIVVLMNRSQSASLSRVCHGICERLRLAATR